MENLDYNLAVLAAALVCFLLVRIHRWWKAGGRFSSPTAGADPAGGAKNQVEGNMAPVLAPGETAVGEEAPAGPGRPRVAEVDRWVAAQPATISTSDLIRRGVDQLAVSPNTIKRALRRRRAGGGR